MDEQNTTVALSPHEAARLAGCGRTTLYAAIASGSLKARKLGRRTLIRRDDLLAWLDRLPTIAPTKAA
ncbi:helix-turn-helix domain-containing protein [Phreatobacter sp.]|uniref:helix-turn-helix domain-containing protein n=1 Tax=Phreatobacter sp. TaxID=1966341 RepID=UPI0022BEAB3D|nr:helix-turn-helix domain-containing protein [Phreatobacter sp.]MCZ8314130.1 helix-turn-helix domain-containing protein [Phreatobacter sp.]